MTFLETDRLSPWIARQSRGGPSFLTSIKTAYDGSEKRIPIWSEPRQQFDLAYGFNFLRDSTPLNLQEVIDQFYVAQGRFAGFRHKDFLDYRIPNVITADENEQIATGDGSAKTFQIVKIYVGNSGQFTRPIEKIVSGTDRVWIDTTELTRVPSAPAAGEYSIDITTGQITTGDTPAGGQAISVQCQFDNAIRFETDQLDLNLATIDTDAESGSLPRVPAISLKSTAVPCGGDATTFLEDDVLPAFYGTLNGGPKFKTQPRVLTSGFEETFVEWLNVRGEWSLDFSVHDLDHGLNPIRGVLELFYVALGACRGFRLDDPADNTLVQETIGTGDGSTTVFQTIKKYNTAAGSYTKTISKPWGQLQAFVDGNPVGSTTNETTGQVTLDSPAGNGLTVAVSGPFHKPVRFAQDRIEFSLAAADESSTAASVLRLGLIELKP